MKIMVISDCFEIVLHVVNITKQWSNQWQVPIMTWAEPSQLLFFSSFSVMLLCLCEDRMKNIFLNILYCVTLLHADYLHTATLSKKALLDKSWFKLKVYIDKDNFVFVVCSNEMSASRNEFLCCTWVEVYQSKVGGFLDWNWCKQSQSKTWYLDKRL